MSNDCLRLFAAHRVVQIRHDEVIQGVLLPGLDETHPQVRGALSAWEGTHFLHHTGETVRVTLVRATRPRPRERWWLHLLLALLTLLSTSIAGAYLAGREPLELRLLSLGPLPFPLPVKLHPHQLLPGLAFSVPLLLILLGHELGHYLLARRWGMDVSPPYFLPAPSWISFIGTFGAFIRLRSVVVNRVVLLDVGMGGPLASFLLSLPAVMLGLAWSRGGAAPPGTPGAYAVLFAGQPVWLGGSLAFDALAALFAPAGQLLLLHPLAFAGWIGLFVTALNLFPLAQLDGGHILYALAGPAQRWVGLAFLGALLLLGQRWMGWWVWAAVILLLGRGSTRHPAVLDPAYPVRGVRRALGWACLALLLACFSPVPLS